MSWVKIGVGQHYLYMLRVCAVLETRDVRPVKEDEESQRSGLPRNPDGYNASRQPGAE